MKIKLATIHVDDQDKALAFYTNVLGFQKKADFGNAGYRWLTVVSAEDPEGTELQLALNNNPAAKAYQQAVFEQNQPAAMFFTDSIKADHDRIVSKGGEFKMAPKDLGHSTIAQIADGCGNIIQITELKRW